METIVSVWHQPPGRWFFFHFFFFFKDTATTEIYTLSLHDALPISREQALDHRLAIRRAPAVVALRSAERARGPEEDRKSTRLNSSHMSISYAVFCLKKKKRRNDYNKIAKIITIRHQTPIRGIGVP